MPRLRSHRLRRCGALVLLVPGLALAAPAAAQEPPPLPAPASWGEAEREVLATIQRLFDGMRARDGAMVASTFHPEARLQTSLPDESGRPGVRVGGIDGFISSVGGEGEPWNERIVEAEIRVDQGMAQAWVPYTFHAGDRFSHCGVNSMQLVRMPDGWKILSLVDTRQREGCPGT